MLALATHEPHFYVLREDVFFKDAKKRKYCEKCGKPFHTASNCFSSAKEAAESLKWAHQVPFLLLNIARLREHLRTEFSQVIKTFHLSLERIIDDWIFLIFFVGNDFLPHLPSLEIREGAIDRLVKIYKDEFLIKRAPLAISDPSKEACYLTKYGEVNLLAVKTIMTQIGSMEDDIFKQRKERHDKEERKSRAIFQKSYAPVQQNLDQLAFKPVTFVKSNQSMTEEVEKIARIPSQKETIENNLKLMLKLPIAPDPMTPRTCTKSETIEGLLKSVLGLSLTESPPDYASRETPAGVSGAIDNTDAPVDIMHPIDDPLEEEEEALLDDVCLWESGYRERYYAMKFYVPQAEEEQLALRRNLVEFYMQGLAWVLQYYYIGCPSWDWYYPYHYAPFAADFSLSPMVSAQSFQLGEPFRPFEQLLGVLPDAYAELMHSHDSEILEFYPLDFSIDLNGAKQPWKAVILLPFIDSTRLIQAAKQKNHRLNATEQARNTFGENILYVSTRHSLSHLLCHIDQPPYMTMNPLSTDHASASCSSLVSSMKPTQIAHHQSIINPKKTWMNPPVFQGIDGALTPYSDAVIPGSTYHCRLKTLSVSPILGVKSWSAIYHVPFDRKKVVFKSLYSEEPKSFPHSKLSSSVSQRKTAALKGLAQSMAPYVPNNMAIKSTQAHPLDYNHIVTKRK
jgi:5'-3' exoribonuclease 2